MSCSRRRRIGYSWREERWDTFCLVTPNWQCTLPDYPYHGRRSRRLHAEGRDRRIPGGVRAQGRSADPRGRHGRRRSPARADAHVSCRQDVERKLDHRPRRDGHFRLPPAGDPARRRALPARPLPDPFGRPIAIPAADSGRRDPHRRHRAVRLPRSPRTCTSLAARCTSRSAARRARRATYRGKDTIKWLHEMGYYEMNVDTHPLGTEVRKKANHYFTGRGGGHEIDLRQFAAEGMKLYGMLDKVDGDIVTLQARPRQANLEVGRQGLSAYPQDDRRLHRQDGSSTRRRPSPTSPPWEVGEEPTHLSLSGLEHQRGDLVDRASAPISRWSRSRCSTGQGYPGPPSRHYHGAGSLLSRARLAVDLGLGPLLRHRAGLRARRRGHRAALLVARPVERAAAEGRLTEVA